MANEYLTRTLTSSGNRKVFTWAGWVKRQQDAYEIISFSSPNTVNDGLVMFGFNSSGNTGIYLNFYQSSTSRVYEVDEEYRDFGSWLHYQIVVDTTQATEDDRLNLYINGVQRSLSVNSGYSAIPQNYLCDNMTAGQETLLGVGRNSAGNLSGYAKLELSDIFFIDGQALTPDVFGFYKEGKGYQSSGTTQATDFRPGQWSPHSPRKIKTEIERKGGFGVNGFYLPMNDSSNPGADFHCTPNSIITLKGEDLPQPRNGAPTTSDAYVSQLRSDPYAANLVLAVPGIALENTNTELVTNGTFDTGISGWTGYNSTPTWDSLNQRLAIDAPTEFDGAETSSGISVSANTNYTLSLDIFLGTAGGVRIQIRDSANAGGTLPTVDIDVSGSHTINFNSLSNTSVYLRLMSSGGNTGTAYFDNISIKEAVPVRDYSADIKGSGTNKTLTTNGDAGVAIVSSYYGSAMGEFSSTSGGTNDYLNVSNSSDFNMGTGDFTVEAWVKHTDVSSGIGLWFSSTNNSTSNYWQIGYRSNTFGGSNGPAVWYNNSVIVSGSGQSINQWDHIAWVREGNTMTVFLNGVAIGVNTNVTTSVDLNGANNPQIGSYNNNGDQYNLNGYIQDLRVYKGVAKYKGGFDVPKPYSPVGIETWRAVPDCTANNFATLNPLASRNILSNGNLTATFDNTVAYNATISNFMMKSGKWYCEVRYDEESTGSISVGVHNLRDMRYIYGGTSPYFFGGAGGSNDFTVNNGVRDSPAANDGDIIQMKLDLDSSPVVFSVAVNGGAYTDFQSGVNSGYNFLKEGESYGFVAADAQSGVTGMQATFNFGQNPTFSGQTTAGTFTDSNGKGLFKYQPPSGFLALCEDNLPTPAIKNPGEYFKTVLYTGDGTSGTTSIKGFGFKPDLIWLKGRSATGNHGVWDIVRGATNRLTPNLTDSESTSNGVISFDDDGFSRGIPFSASGSSYVAWGWRAGAGTTTANTDGSINSVVSVNQDAGFSIVSYTGTGSAGTVGHGLGKNPSMIIVKGRINTDHWFVYNSNLTTPTTQYLYLNLTSSETSGANPWNSTNPTSSVFSLGTDGGVNGGGGNTYIAYCWAEVEGFSKFGSYVGNGSADGAFVYCGFKPAFVMLKASSTTGNWCMIDNARNSTNPTNFFTVANAANNGDDTGGALDFLSNGFKLRLSSSNFNGSGTTYIFAAFAESPFQTANAK